MKFYTNALEFGNNILVRGYDRGQAFSEKIPYKPKMFVPSKRANAEWRGRRGEHVIIYSQAANGKEHAQRAPTAKQ